MFKLPTVHVTIPGKTSKHRFVPVYEAPMLAALWRGKGPADSPNPIVEPMPPGQAAEHYWHCFESVEAEYGRLAKNYCQTNDRPDIISRFFPDPNALAERIESELLKLIRQGSTLPPEATEMVAPQALVELAIRAGVAAAPEDPKLRNPALSYADDVAKALAVAGFTRVAEVAKATISALCKAKLVGPALAHELMIAAGGKLEEDEAALSESRGAASALGVASGPVAL